MLRNLIRAAALVLATALGSVSWLAWFALAPLSLSATPLDFSIRAGSSLRSASRQIQAAGVDMFAWQFELLGRLAGRGASIKAGSYEVTQGTTGWALLQKVTQGEFSQAEVTFIEGWTFRQVRAALDAHPSVKHDTAGMDEAAIMQRLAAAAPQGAKLADAAEGRFFPDTYLFGKGESDLSILRRAMHAMDAALQSAWSTRAGDLPLATPYEALILASIVEKETGAPRDRELIASVFANRLRIGMRLQTDPTVIYGLGERFDGNLRRRDLVQDTPHNTYTREGLPPTPIAMPGAASLRAATQPAKSDFLYFVARGDGSSEFSRTLEAHNRAVSKYQRGGR